MHKLNVLILGPVSFVSTLNELKTYLKFNSIFKGSTTIHNIILFHNDALNDKKQKEIIDASNSIKICATTNKKSKLNYDANIELPVTLKEINTIVENIAAKKNLAKILLLMLKIIYLIKTRKHYSNQINL